jgi:hypothetical protein
MGLGATILREPVLLGLSILELLLVESAADSKHVARLKKASDASFL